MTDKSTPRTDALGKDERHNTVAETSYWCDQYKTFARTLERELAECRSELEKLRAAHELGWAHKVCPNCGTDMMTESRLASHAEREDGDLAVTQSFLGDGDPAPSAASGLADHIEGLMQKGVARMTLGEPGWREIITALRSRPAQDRDAERYRWLRARPSLIGWDWWPTKVSRRTDISPEFMDYAIDAAMSQQEGK